MEDGQHDMRSIQLTVTGFEDRGRRQQAKEYGQALETRKGKETSLPSASGKKHNPADVLILPREAHSSLPTLEL